MVWRHVNFQVWQDPVKSASTRDPSKTPAPQPGIVSRRWTVGGMLRRKLLAARMRVREWAPEYYFGIEPRPFSVI